MKTCSGEHRHYGSDRPHDHGVGSMVVSSSRDGEPHHHHDVKCLEAAEQELDRLTKENKQLKADQLKFYKADGSFIVCESVEQVVEMRKAAAAEIARLTNRPTEWVYNQVCQARTHWMERAEKAEAERDRLKEYFKDILIATEVVDAWNKPGSESRRIANLAIKSEEEPNQ